MSSAIEWVLDDGQHLLGVGDLEAPGVVEELAQAHFAREGKALYDHAYTDPPWNAGIGRMFRKWAGQELDRSVDVDALLRATTDWCASQVRGWSFVQIGKQKHDVLRQCFLDSGLTLQSEIACTHVNDGGTVVQGDAWLFAGFPATSVKPPVVDPSASWMQLASDVLAQVAQPGETVVDWYMGQGMVLRVAESLGLRSYGVEINRKRALEAVARLEKDRRRGGLVLT